MLVEELVALPEDRTIYALQEFSLGGEGLHGLVADCEVQGRLELVGVVRIPRFLVRLGQVDVRFKVAPSLAAVQKVACQDPMLGLVHALAHAGRLLHFTSG